MFFFPRKFLTEEEGSRIIEHIVEAENNTSGEIRVHFQRKLHGDVMDAAVHTFNTLGMDKTEARNGVLIFIVPRKKVFAIIGDKGINDVMPEDFWDQEKEILKSHFKDKKCADGICKVIHNVGTKLKEYFPIQDDDKNELPDEISYS